MATIMEGGNQPLTWWLCVDEGQAVAGDMARLKHLKPETS